MTEVESGTIIDVRVDVEQDTMERLLALELALHKEGLDDKLDEVHRKLDEIHEVQLVSPNTQVLFELSEFLHNFEVDVGKKEDDESELMLTQS